MVDVDWSLPGIGVITGLLVGVTGVGGGAVMTPLLVLHGGVAPLTAVGTDLWCAAFTKAAASGLHYRTQLIEWRVVRRLWMGSLPAAALSLLWLGTYGRDMTGLTLAIGAAVAVSALGMAVQARLHAVGRALRTTHAQRFKRAQPPLTVLAGAVIGMLVTTTSVGAGALGAIALAYLYPLRLTPAKLVASDIAHGVPLALCAGVGHLLIGTVDGALLVLLLAGSIPGVLAGAWLSSRIRPEHMRRLLAVVLLLAGGRLIWMAW